jgi:hypothetical protein
MNQDTQAQSDLISKHMVERDDSREKMIEWDFLIFSGHGKRIHSIKFL